jgi:hypothetical protein
MQLIYFCHSNYDKKFSYFSLFNCKKAMHSEIHHKDVLASMRGSGTGSRIQQLQSTTFQ